ncbi:hypothetical protein BHE74_00001227 [Ensete ventricosum]|nr:hypothetical protein GW17_00040979 [Ensete ventricosum]RWW89740.1 hypothetical protein BHE74_00001227 [Ensete ventricosum]
MQTARYQAVPSKSTSPRVGGFVASFSCGKEATRRGLVFPRGDEATLVSLRRDEATLVFQRENEAPPRLPARGTRRRLVFPRGNEASFSRELPNDKWNVFVGPDRGPPAVPENPRLRGEDHGWHEEGDLLRPWVRQTDRGRRSAMTDVAAEGRCRIRTVFASEVGSS